MSGAGRVSELSLENIYRRERSAACFARAVTYDAPALAALAREVFARAAAPAPPGAALRVLDVGSGDGSFILPFLDALEAAGRADYSLDCFDASGHMARLFRANLAARPASAAKVTHLTHDAERGLPAAFRSPGRYHLAFVTFVLQYVGGWRRLLDEVVSALAPGGAVVQAEVVGDFRNLDGQFDADSPILFRQFWERYFTERAAYSAWAPAISVTDIAPALTYLRDKHQMRLAREEARTWEALATWSDFCDWIAEAPVSSLGSGLDDGARADLARRMRAWVEERGVEPAAAISLTWGVRVICLTGTR